MVAYLRVCVFRVNEGVDVLDAAVHANDQQESFTIREGRACALNRIPHNNEYMY